MLGFTTQVKNKVLLEARQTHRQDEVVLQMVYVRNETMTANMNEGMEALKGVIMQANAKVQLVLPKYRIYFITAHHQPGNLQFQEIGECSKVKQSYEHNMNMEKVLISSMKQEGACLAFLRKIDTDIVHSSRHRHQTNKLLERLQAKIVLGQQDHAVHPCKLLYAICNSRIIPLQCLSLL